MMKSRVTRMWITGLGIMVAGLVVGGVSLGLMFAFGGQWVAAPETNGSTFVPSTDGFFWTMVSLEVIGFTAAVVGGILQLVAWIGALVNTARLPDKLWFIVLLVGGVIGFSLPVMIAYLIAGPDDAVMPLFYHSYPPYPPYPSYQAAPEQPPTTTATMA